MDGKVMVKRTRENPQNPLASFLRTCILSPANTSFVILLAMLSGMSASASSAYTHTHTHVRMHTWMSVWLASPYFLPNTHKTGLWVSREGLSENVMPHCAFANQTAPIMVYIRT